MNDKEIKNIIEEIRSGKVGGIHYLTPLPPNPQINKNEYLHLLGRAIFIKKIRDKKRERREKLFYYGVCSIILIKWFFML